MTGGQPDNQKLADFNDTLLVEEIVAGNKELFRLLIERYQQRVHAMGLSFFHNQEDAADFTQDVFIRSYRSLAAFRGQARFSTWLYRIAYNMALNGINRRKNYLSLIEEPITEKENPEQQMLQSAAKKAVRSAVEELPEKYRVCIDLYFFYDCSINEIGVITGFPENTIKSHVFRAKKLLRETLKGENYEM